MKSAFLNNNIAKYILLVCWSKTEENIEDYIELAHLEYGNAINFLGYLSTINKLNLEKYKP
jgi:hypothetical protein